MRHRLCLAFIYNKIYRRYTPRVWLVGAPPKGISHPRRGQDKSVSMEGKKESRCPFLSPRGTFEVIESDGRERRSSSSSSLLLPLLLRPLCRQSVIADAASLFLSPSTAGRKFAQSYKSHTDSTDVSIVVELSLITSISPPSPPPSLLTI